MTPEPRKGGLDLRDKSAPIACSICRRPHHTLRLPFLCAVDARNKIYEGRLEKARALIKNEEIAAEVENVLNDQGNGTGRAMEAWKSEQAVSADRTTDIIAQADRLKIDIDAARKELEAKKVALDRRKSDLASVSDGLEARRSRHFEDAQKAIQRTGIRWKRSAENLAATRVFLCDEAARLYGLRQVRKGNTKRYEIGGIEIVELHNMNNTAPELISAYLGHTSQLLTLASHYLAVRLPSEMTLPHNDYPRPTVFTLANSYKYTGLPFPGSENLTGRRDSEPQHVPYPRPLFIDKPLGQLAKEDPCAYAYFLEGVSLLAYNIAWLCCSQGVVFGDKNSYEDICNIGQNLWRLLIGDQLHRKSVEPTFPSPLAAPDEVLAKPKSQIGHWSHGTAHTFLAGPEGTEFVRSFKLLAPKQITDRLKRRLSSEAMLEWEKIDGDEARGGEEEYDEGVLVRPRCNSMGDGGDDDLGVESILSVRPPPGPGASPSKGTSGWTKLKGR